LFDRKHARIRSEEEGDYVGIAEDHKAPPSDLLEVLHRYTSRFYDRPEIKRKHLHYRSMDGTALLALGFLIEEALSDSLGETGHLSFVGLDEEDAEVPPELLDRHDWVKPPRKRRKREVRGDEASDDLDGNPSEISDELGQNSGAENTSSSPKALRFTTKGHLSRKKRSKYKSAQFVVDSDDDVMTSAHSSDGSAQVAKNSRRGGRDKYKMQSKPKSTE